MRGYVFELRCFTTICGPAVRMLVDRYGRVLKSLRIVVNSECNLNCVYCHREGLAGEARRIVLSPNEIGLVSRIAIRLGIERFKLTGGEPLLRGDIVDVVKVVADAKPRDLSMTTNGTLLTAYAHSLAEAGLKRVNVGLPSLKRSRYSYITGSDLLDQAIAGVRVAYDYGLRPITINVVVLKGVTESEYEDFIRFAAGVEARIRFIELEPIGSGKQVFNELYEPVDKVVERLEKSCVKRYTREEGLRPVYVLDNGVEVEIVKWYKNTSFCMHCDRIRLMYNGLVKPCIAAEAVIDLSQCLRPSVDERCIENAIVNANTVRKPFWHTFREVYGVHCP